MWLIINLEKKYCFCFKAQKQWWTVLILFSWLNSSRNQRKNSWSGYLQRQPGWNQWNGTWWGICKKDCHWNVGWISRIWCQWMFHPWQLFFLYCFCYSCNKLWPSFVGIPFLKPVMVRTLIFTKLRLENWHITDIFKLVPVGF